MTLAELAGKELSAGLLSKIERGLVRPSLETLLLLARRVDKPPSYFLDHLEEGSKASPPDLAAGRALAEGRALLALGAVGDAAARFEAATQAPQVHQRAEALIGRGFALLAGNRLSEARELLEAGARLAEAAPPAAALRAWGLLGLGNCSQRAGAASHALALLQQAIAAAEAAANEDGWTHDIRAAALAAMAAIHRGRGENETARLLYRQAARLLTQAATALRRSRHQLLAARQAGQAGESAAAWLAAERAAELAALVESSGLALQVEQALRELVIN